MRSYTIETNQTFLKKNLATFISLLLLLSLIVITTLGINNYNNNPQVIEQKSILSKITSIKNNTDYPNEQILKRSVLNSNQIMLNALAKKINKHEKIKVAFLGGSITAGAGAKEPNERFSTQLIKDLNSTYGSLFTEINFGFGSTDSYLGIFRFDEEIINQNPDLIIVDYAVNDNSNYTVISYENLIRKIVNNKIPTIALFNMDSTGYNKQEIQTAVCKYYNVPAISYQDAYYPLIKNGSLKWDDIAVDDVHPNDRGHKLIEYLLYDYLVNNLNFNNQDSYNFKMPDVNFVDHNDFAKTSVLQYGNSAFTKNDGFVSWENPFYFKGNGFVSSNLDSSMEFKFFGSSLGLSYFSNNDLTNGKLEITVDDMYTRVIDGYGTSDQAPTELLASNLSGKEHLVKVRMISDDSRKKIKFNIIAFLIGG